MLFFIPKELTEDILAYKIEEDTQGTTIVSWGWSLIFWPGFCPFTTSL
jgi:hypothetical protein